MEFEEVLIGDIFGSVTPAVGGMSLPAGRYRFTQADGCMKYGSTGHGWTVQNPNHTDCWWAVTTDANGGTTELLFLPGTEGLTAGLGAYATFSECLTANAQPPHTAEFDFSGGPLGIWLRDNPYGDNLTQNGNTPRWRLQCVSRP